MIKHATGGRDNYFAKILRPGFFLTPALVLAPAASSFAQETDALQEIIVTAEKRAESLQNVPVAVSALTADQLQSAGLSSVDSLGQGVAGLTMTRYAQATQPFIRGVGSQSLNVGQEGAVATYVDGVYIGDSYALPFEFNNVERIEVLKGPQGTLYGRNATGGLINIITQTPQSDPVFKASLGYGSDQTYRGTAYLSGGNDNVAADLALFALNQEEGFGKWLLSGRDANFQREYGARSKMLLTLSDEDSLTFAADYYINEGDMGSVRAPFPGSVMAGGIVADPWSYDSKSDAEVTIGSNYSGGLSLNYTRDVGATSLNVISAYRKSVRDVVLDNDATEIGFSTSCLCTSLETLQNEIFLTGTAGKIDWTAGLFTWYTDAQFSLAVRSEVTPPANIDRLTNQTTVSYAAYTQGTYALNDTTNLTAGFRLTRDTRSVSGQTTSAVPNPAGDGTVLATFTPDEVSSEAPSWRLSLDKHLTDNLMTYVSYNRGFKSGTYNTTNGAAPPVKDETIDAYEVGAKSELWGRRVRINAAVFKYDYKDIQLNSVQTGITSIFNAASAEMKGVDASAEFAPTMPVGRLAITAGVAYLDANYEEFPNGPVNTPRPVTVGGNIVALGDLSGNEMIRSPKWTYNGSVAYSVPVMGHPFSTNISYYHNSGFFWEPDNRLTQDAYGIVNASIELSLGADDKYRLGLWGRNLTDEEYDVYAAEATLGDFHSAGFPRTYGINLEVEF